MTDGRRPVAVGLFVSLGHSTVVVRSLVIALPTPFRLWSDRRDRSGPASDRVGASAAAGRVCTDPVGMAHHRGAPTTSTNESGTSVVDLSSSMANMDVTSVSATLEIRRLYSAS